MFWPTRKQDPLLAEYRAIISDLRDQIRDKERLIGDLTDKVIALSAPASLREVKRPPLPPADVSGGKSNNVRTKMHWPGLQPATFRPPSPKTPPTSAPLKAPALTDAQIIEAVSRAGESPDGG